ncbi:MAG: hypothetical protein BWY29_01023 [Microgenomates group bacterium ADurb.Bin238]|nr:MAG: hypothetical protein BWY29_01023 [Microgenomates group bacterium ADurb.Bin238]
MGQAVSILGVEYTAIEMRKGQWSLFTKDNRAVDWQTSFGLRVEEATQVASSDDPGGQAKMIGDTQISPVEVAQLLDIRGEVMETVIRPIRAIVVEGAENPTLVDMPPRVTVTKNGIEVELTLNEDGEYIDVDGKKYNYSVVGQVPEGTNRLAVVEDGSGFSLWAFTKEGATEVGRINFEKQSEIPIGAELAVGEGRQVTEAEMDLVRNGVEDERFLAMKKGFVFAFADTEGNKQVAMVVVPSQFEIGDLSDPNPNTYPQWREGPNINPADMGEIMRIAFGKDWKATDRLVILGISDVPGAVDFQYSGTTGFLTNIGVDTTILPNTGAHLRVFPPDEPPFASISQTKYIEAIKNDVNYIYFDNTTFSVYVPLEVVPYANSNKLGGSELKSKMSVYEASLVLVNNLVRRGGIVYPFRVWYTGPNAY